jgi:mutator protein MutT
MKTEISAGGVIVRKTSTTYEVLCIRDMSNTWTFPKGLIEEGETPESAATREIQEEVGLTHVRYISPLSTIQYMYKRNGLIQKTVHYFLFIQTKKQTPVCQKSEGIKEAKWMNFTNAKKYIGYRDTNVPMLAKAEEAMKL